MSEAAGNGVTAGPGVDAPSRLAEIVAELRVELHDAERELERFLAGVDERKAKINGIRRAIDSLDISTRSRTPGRPRKGIDLRGAERARPGGQHIDAVLTELINVGEPQTRTQMVERLRGRMSHDVVRRALLALREDERVRIAGQTGRGGVLYAPMPEELGGEQHDAAVAIGETER